MKTSIKSNIIFNIIKNMSTLIFPLISFSYISRILGADGIGKINFTKVIIEYFIILAAMGIRGYGIREGAKVRDSREKLSVFVKEILIINIGSIVVAYILLFISLLFVDKFIEYRMCILIQCVVIFFGQIGCDWFYEAIEEYPYIAIRNTAFRILSLILTFLLVKEVGDYIKYIFIWTICECGNGILNFFMLNRYIDFNIKSSCNIKQHLPGIFSLFVFTLSNNLYSNIDIIMLGFMLASYQVGIYSVAIKIIKISTTLITSMGVVLMPRIANYICNKMIKKISILVHRIIDLMLMFSIPMVTGIVVLRKEIIIVFCGKEYLEASLTLIILARLGIVTPVYSFINSCVFIPFQKEKYMYIATGVALGSNVGLNLLLIPKYAINGAAIATIIAEFLGAMTAIYLGRCLISFKSTCKNLGIYLMAIIPEIFILKSISVIINNTLLKLFFGIIGGAIIYIVVIYLLKKELIVEKIKRDFDVDE